MLWKRLSLTRKLFVAIALNTAMIVALMAFPVSLSMREGFSQYVLQAEVDRLDLLEIALANKYNAENRGWPELSNSKTAWQNFVADNLGPNIYHFRRNSPPPPFAANDRSPPEAVEACEKQAEKSSCSFVNRRRNGTVEGTCQTVKDDILACVPNDRRERPKG